MPKLVKLCNQSYVASMSQPAEEILQINCWCEVVSHDVKPRTLVIQERTLCQCKRQKTHLGYNKLCCMLA